jgi:hypothetical protein
MLSPSFWLSSLALLGDFRDVWTIVWVFQGAGVGNVTQLLGMPFAEAL